MSKNPNNHAKPVKKSEPMTGAMKFFLAGCVAELYLLIVRRYYANGTTNQQIAWFDHYFKVLVAVGVAVLAVGVVLSLVWKADKKKRVYGWSVTGAGAFLAISTGLVWWQSTPALSVMSVIVPVVMLLGILWKLYDRECAMSLSILGATLIVLWVCRNGMDHMFLGTYVKVGAALYIVLMGVIAYLLRKGKLTKLLPASADDLPVYTACGLSAVSVLLTYFASSMITYYVMWGLAIVVFALAVYYTVKQL